jgi:phospho-N-acetylmuramoyl-pentapeptide-transferase
MNIYFTFIPAGAAFLITALCGFAIVPWLRRLKFGQTILEIGPAWHKAKQGTPTMGGFMFALSITVVLISAALADYFLQTGVVFANALDGFYDLVSRNIRLFAGFFAAIGYGIIGFTDDYIKVVKKRNLGLTAKQKTFSQMLVSAAYLYTLFAHNDARFHIPFFGLVDFTSNLTLTCVYWLVGLVMLYGFVNAVNLTDGVDGLCGIVTAVASAGFFVLAFLLKNQSSALLAGTCLGACLGWLLWNKHPAKVFMGDTGSMFLGGIVIAMAFLIGYPLLLFQFGIIYFCESLSVIIQVAYFKKTKGKRIFKMTPIHHHFELSKWSENKICVVFSLVTLLGAAAGLGLLYWQGIIPLGG